MMNPVFLFSESRVRLARAAVLLVLLGSLSLGVVNAARAQATAPLPKPARTIPAEEAEKNLVLPRPTCQYPGTARSMGVSGTVQLKIYIDPTGKVPAAKAMSGPQELRSGAVRCAELYHYQPFQIDGKPMPVASELALDFPQHGDMPGGRQQLYERNTSTANMLLSRGDLTGSATLYQKNLDMANEENPKSQLEIAEAAGALGHIRMRQGKPEVAAGLLKQALDGYDAVGVTQNPRVGRTVEELAGIYLDQKKFPEAEALFKRSISIFLPQKLSAADPTPQKTASSSIAQALFGLAAVSFESGDQKQAAVYCDRTLTELKDSNLPDSELKRIYLNCSGVNRSIGRIELADELKKRADAIKTADDDSPKAPPKTPGQ